MNLSVTASIKRILFVVHFMAFTSLGTAQTRTQIIDSLLIALEQTRTDTGRIIIFNKLSENYRQSDKDKSLHYALKALEASKKSEWKKGYFKALINQGLTMYTYGERKKALELFLDGLKEAETEKHLSFQSNFASGAANCYYQMGDRENALKYNLLSNSFSEKLNDKKATASGLMNIGLSYGEMGNYKKELECYRKALVIQEEMKDYPNAANTLENLGIFFIFRGDSANAFRNLRKALELRIKLGDKNLEAGTMNNIAGAYSNFGNLDACLSFLMKSLKIHEALGDYSGMAASTGNIAETYGQMGDYAKAIEYSKRSMDANIRTHDSAGIAITLKNLAMIYMKTGKLKEAEDAARQSFDICKKYGSQDMITESYSLLAEVLFKKGDTRNAYLLHKQYSALKDSVLSAENSKQINEMNAKYESEKKDKDLLMKDNEIKNREADARQKSYQRNAFVAGFCILLVLAFFIFRSYKLKKNAHVAISRQKEEVEKAKEVIEEKQKEILDSINYAKRIQTSLLPTEKYIDKSLNRLQKK